MGEINYDLLIYILIITLWFAFPSLLTLLAGKSKGNMRYMFIFLGAGMFTFISLFIFITILILIVSRDPLVMLIGAVFSAGVSFIFAPIAGLLVSFWIKDRDNAIKDSL